MATVTRSAELNNGVWTSWLPLTTAWPSQAACNSEVWARNAINVNASYWPYEYDPAYGQSVANTLTCLPPQVTKWWNGATEVSNTITSWSIAPIVCPAAFTTVSTTVISGSSTSVICCPTNFSLVRGLPSDPGLDGVCSSVIPPGQIVIYASPTGNKFTSATTSFTVSALMLAAPVQGYNFAASTTSSSSTPTNSSTSGASNSQSSTNISGATQTPEHSSGLATGAKAGIGAGVAVAVLVAAIVGFIIFRRRQKYKPAPTSELPATEQHKYPEHKNGQLVEANSEAVRPRWEVDGQSRPAELG